MTRKLLVLMACAACLGLAQAEQAKAGEIQRLIKQLGSRKYKERQAAGKAVRCPSCQQVVTVPAATAPST